MFGRKKRSSAVAPKAGDEYLTLNKGRSGEYQVKVMKRLPKNWKQVKGATTAPNGFIWVSNNKSLFGGERKMALIKDKSYPKDLATKVKILGRSTVKAKDKKAKDVAGQKTVGYTAKIKLPDGKVLIASETGLRDIKTLPSRIVLKSKEQALQVATNLATAYGKGAKPVVGTENYKQKNVVAQAKRKAK